MVQRTVQILWGLLVLCYIGETECTLCSTYEIGCRDGSRCIRTREICDKTNNCPDASDEDPDLCKHWSRDYYDCSADQYSCNGICINPYELCGFEPLCRKNKPPVFCQVFDKGVLQLSGDGQGMELSDRMVELMQRAVLSPKWNSSCPMFYVPVGGKCLSFFSPAKVLWPEARQFCTSIGGDLVSIGDVGFFDQILSYMRDAHLTSDYWIGGRFDIDSNAWTWVQDDATMPLGSPYWGTKYNSSCMDRHPAHTSPKASPLIALPGSRCFNYLQMPWNHAAGWCAAMTYEHYHFFSDESCQVESFSPLCLFNSLSED